MVMLVVNKELEITSHTPFISFGLVVKLSSVRTSQYMKGNVWFLPRLVSSEFLAMRKHGWFNTYCCQH